MLFSFFTRNSGIAGYNLLSDFVLLIASIVQTALGVQLLPTGLTTSGGGSL